MHCTHKRTWEMRDVNEGCKQDVEAALADGYEPYSSSIVGRYLVYSFKRLKPCMECSKPISDYDYDYEWDARFGGSLTNMNKR